MRLTARAALLAAAPGALLLACAPAGARGPAQLAARLFHVEGLEVHPARGAPPELRAACEALAERWSLGRTQGRRAFPTRLVGEGQAGAPRRPRVVVGAPDASPVAELLAHLGFERGPAGERSWLDRPFGSDGVLVATFQDPARPGLPVTVVAGEDPALLSERLALLEPVGWPGARAFRDGDPVYELRLGLDGQAQRATLVDRAAARGELLRRSRVLAEAPAGLEARRDLDVDPDLAAATLGEATRALERARALLGAAAPEHDEPLRLLLVGAPGTLLASHGRVEPVLMHPRLRAATVLAAPGMAPQAGLGLARAALLAGWGAPAEAWLEEAAALELADAWWGRPLAEWGAHLADAALLPEAAALVDPTADLRLSPHVLVPGRALLVRFLRERLGDAGLAAWWRGELGADLPAEERARGRARSLQGFEPWLGLHLQPHLAASRARRDQARAAFLAAPFRRGVALDSLPAPGGNLLGARLAESLAQARSLGADALSQVAYFAEHPPEARFAALLGPPRPGPLEGDATLAAVLGAAGEQGLATSLRTVLLLSEGTSYAGWAVRGRLEEWAQHFEARRAALLHAALLAELLGAELLSVGEDEGDSSSTLPAIARGRGAAFLDVKREGWRAAIGAARSAFSGGLTFLAAFPSEAEHLELWDRLDLVGVLFLPELEATTGEGPSDAELRSQLSRALQRAARLGREQGRPVLLGEVAFRSTRRAWSEPALGFGALDLEEQARLFRAFHQALERARAEPDPFAGYYVWGWGPDPAHGGASDRGFSPQNKPAAAWILR